MTPTTYVFALCDVNAHFSHPSAAGNRALMRKGAECLPELIHFFSACNEEQARFDSLALILATGETTPEIEDLKARILAETQFSIHEKMLLEYENLAKNPDDLALQEK